MGKNGLSSMQNCTFFITLQAITNQIATLIIEVDIYVNILQSIIQYSAVHSLKNFIFFQLFLHVFKSQIFFSNLDYNFSNILDLRNRRPVLSYKKHSVSKIVLTFHFSHKFCKFSAFRLMFQKFTRTIFSDIRSEQFCKQNTKSK